VFLCARPLWLSFLPYAVFSTFRFQRLAFSPISLAFTYAARPRTESGVITTAIAHSPHSSSPDARASGSGQGGYMATLSHGSSGYFSPAK
jgi:hypothetical protein